LPTAMPVCSRADDPKSAIAHPASNFPSLSPPPAPHATALSHPIGSRRRPFSLGSTFALPAMPSIRSLSRCYHAIFPAHLNCNFEGLTPNMRSSRFIWHILLFG
jgi:hypothetical protein